MDCITQKQAYIELPKEWTRELVKQWMQDAADTERTIPQVRARGYVVFWPEIVHSAEEAYAWQPATMNRLKSSAEQYARYDFVSKWCAVLSREQTDILWKRAYGRSHKAIMKDYGMSRFTLNRRINDALDLIVTALIGGLDFDELMRAKAQCAINPAHIPATSAHIRATSQLQT